MKITHSAVRLLLNDSQRRDLTSRLEKAIAEAEQFQEFLSALFESIGKRDELIGVPFDRRAAAEALKLYLGR